MSWEVELNTHAERELEKLPDMIIQPIVDQLIRLKKNPFPKGARKLKGHTGYRLRIGEYRVLYEVDQKAKKVIIYFIGHRRQVYR